MRIDRRAFLALSAQAVALPVLAACGGGEASEEIVAATDTPSPTPATPEPTPTLSPSPTPPSYFDPDLHRLVSKEYALPADFVPEDLETLPAEWLMPGQGGSLVASVIEALEPMMRDAWERDEVDLRIRSAYRSYDTQAQTFAYWVSLLGEEQARRESAEPGHSEHQLGTTMDFADPYNGWELIESFADSPSGLWLAEHAWEYGFALSYPRGAEEVTGYIFEPWHFRFIGVEAAAAWRESGLTLIEFLEEMHALAGTLEAGTSGG